MPDGRPGVVEDWPDRETGPFLRTFFYSRLGLTHWTAAKHLAFVTDTGFTKGYNDQYPGCEVVPMPAAAGNAIVAVNLVKNDGAED